MGRAGEIGEKGRSEEQSGVGREDKMAEKRETSGGSRTSGVGRAERRKAGRRRTG